MSIELRYSDRLLPKRGRSNWTGNQGAEKTCYAHATTRLIARLIKVKFSEYFSGENEGIDKYYDTITCSTQTTIFHCILEDLKESYELEEQIQFATEIMSALLFHFIYNCIIEEFGCKGGRAALAIEYIFEILRANITMPDIKKKLKYDEKLFAEPDNIMFSRFLERLKNICDDINEAIINGFFKPEIFSSNNLGVFSSDPSNAIMMNTLLMPSVRSAIKTKLIKKDNFFSNVLGTIKAVTTAGLYVLLGLHHVDIRLGHDIIISGVDDEDKSLIIKNSWGSEGNNWSIGSFNIITNNRISWIVLQKYVTNPPKGHNPLVPLVELIFIFPREDIDMKSGVSKSVPDIIVTKLSNTWSRFTNSVKNPFKNRFTTRFTRFLGKGRKKKQKKTKRKRKKISN